jgi:membrane-bound inhibitor of C-type lysozyme
MAGFFRKFFSAAPSPAVAQPLYFKDGAAAFEFACSSLQCELVAKGMLPAVVLSAAETLGAETPVVIMPNGTQMLALCVASKDGGFLVLAGALSASGPSLRPGDLVAWHAGQPIERKAVELAKDPRSQWVGVVVAKLKPEYTFDKGWAIAEPFRP